MWGLVLPVANEEMALTCCFSPGVCGFYPLGRGAGLSQARGRHRVFSRDRHTANHGASFFHSWTRKCGNDFCHPPED